MISKSLLMQELNCPNNSHRKQITNFLQFKQCYGLTICFCTLKFSEHELHVKHQSDALWILTHFPNTLRDTYYPPLYESVKAQRRVGPAWACGAATKWKREGLNTSSLAWELVLLITTGSCCFLMSNQCYSWLHGESEKVSLDSLVVNPKLPLIT